MSIPKILIFFGFLFLVFGGYLVNERYSPKKLEFKDFEASKTYSSQTVPVRIIIPSLGIDSGIFPAQISNGNWEATTKGVSYLSSTPIPGGVGNSVLYGHNWPSLLGSLPKIKPGDEIVVILNSGQKKTFVVRYTSVVSPDQTDILKDTNDARITLYTCTGFLDSKRFVATAILAN